MNSSGSVSASPTCGGSNSNVLNDVAVVSASDVWAVGSYSNDGTTSQTLIEQWNGTNWSVVPSPNAGTVNNTLKGVAVSANNIWTVGYYDNSNGNEYTLIEFYC